MERNREGAVSILRKGLWRILSALVLILAMLCGIVTGLNFGVSKAYAATAPSVGDTVSFGDRDWVCISTSPRILLGVQM